MSLSKTRWTKESGTSIERKENNIAVKRDTHAQLTVEDEKILEIQDVEEDDAYLVYDQNMKLISVEVPEEVPEEVEGENYGDKRQTFYRTLFVDKRIENESSYDNVQPEEENETKIKFDNNFRIQHNQSFVSDEANDNEASLLSESKTPNFLHSNSMLSEKDKEV